MGLIGRALALLGLPRQKRERVIVHTVTGPKVLADITERPGSRCESRKRKDKRSWRCTRVVGHAGMHYNGNGGRRWY